MSDYTEPEANVVARLATGLSNKATDALDGKGVLVPDGYHVEDTERFQEAPRRVDEKVQAHTLQGFLEYFSEFQSDTTAVFGDPLDGHVTAVFDYHQGGEMGGGDPQWGDHVLTFSPDKSRQLRAWLSNDGEMQTQRWMAEFIEERAEDFVEPSAARMLEIARTFEAKKNVDFSQASRLDNGDVQIKYEEETKTTGDVQVPEKFTLGLPVYKGGDRFEVKARLRYRVKAGGLQLGYKLLRIDDVKEAAAGDILDAVEDVAEENDVPVFYAHR